MFPPVFVKRAFVLALSLNLCPAAEAADVDKSPYTYCSGDSCQTHISAPTFGFGKLPKDVHTHCKLPMAYAMTFDDGPSANWPAVLGILASHAVKATFFVVGSNLGTEAQKEILREAHRQGHQISNHTFTHPDLMKLSDADIVDQARRTEAAIVEALGDTPEIRHAARTVRPPFGYIDQRVLNALSAAGFSAVRWNSDRTDWDLGADKKATVMQRLEAHLAYVKGLGASAVNPSILDLNHDFSMATLGVLDQMIDRIKAADFQFQTVDDCIAAKTTL